MHDKQKIYIWILRTKCLRFQIFRRQRRENLLQNRHQIVDWSLLVVSLSLEQFHMVFSVQCLIQCWMKNKIGEFFDFSKFSNKTATTSVTKKQISNQIFKIQIKFTEWISNGTNITYSTWKDFFDFLSLKNTYIYNLHEYERITLRISVLFILFFFSWITFLNIRKMFGWSSIIYNWIHFDSLNIFSHRYSLFVFRYQGFYPCLCLCYSSNFELTIYLIYLYEIQSVFYYVKRTSMQFSNQGYPLIWCLILFGFLVKIYNFYSCLPKTPCWEFRKFLDIMSRFVDLYVCVCYVYLNLSYNPGNTMYYKVGYEHERKMERGKKRAKIGNWIKGKLSMSKTTGNETRIYAIKESVYVFNGGIIFQLFHLIGEN